MAVLVSITPKGGETHVRRYVASAGVVSALCTHAGSYAPEGVTLVNVEYYRERGAPQDLIRRRRRDTERAAS